MHWIKNGPDAAKPTDDVLIRNARGKYTVAYWSPPGEDSKGTWVRVPGYYSLDDAHVTHFAKITEPPIE
jgi:hypothetical protein